MLYDDVIHLFCMHVPINAGVAVALGSDFNPNAYCMSMVRQIHSSRYSVTVNLLSVVQHPSTWACYTVTLAIIIVFMTSLYIMLFGVLIHAL